MEGSAVGAAEGGSGIALHQRTARSHSSPPLLPFIPWVRLKAATAHQPPQQGLLLHVDGQPPPQLAASLLPTPAPASEHLSFPRPLLLPLVPAGTPVMPSSTALLLVFGICWASPPPPLLLPGSKKGGQVYFLPQHRAVFSNPTSQDTSS